MAAPNARAPMVITHEGGVRFAAQVRTHRIVVDQPIRAGGEGTGPAPVELLGVALGTCVAFYVQQFCQGRALPVEGLRVEVDQQGAQNPARVERFVVRVQLPDNFPARYVDLVQRIARSCPAHNTLVHGSDVTIEIEADAATTV